MTSIRIRDERHWHELRLEHVGGSEVAALFGEHPQLTRYELWHQKAGLLPVPEFTGNERVFWGTTLEPAIAAGVADKTGWNVRKVRRYHSRLPELGLGGSLDYEIVANDKGPGILEIKTVDWLVARGWEGEPPLNYELQVQSYLACTGRAWGAMAVLIGGNDLKVFEYERRPKTVATIEAEIAGFWRSIAEGIPPKPDFDKDGAAIGKLYGAGLAGKTVDLTGHNRLPELILEYSDGAAEEGANKRRRERARAEILTVVGDAETVLCGTWRIKFGTVAATPDQIIGPEMIGTVLKGRSAYRTLRISERRDLVA